MEHYEDNCLYVADLRKHSSNSAWNASTLKIGLRDSLETSVTNYQSTKHNIPEEHVSHLQRGESLKSHILPRFFMLRSAQLTEQF